MIYLKRPVERDERFDDWILAIYEIDKNRNPQPFLDLLTPLVSQEVMPYIEDLFNRKFCKHKQGHHSRPLYDIHPTKVAAGLVRLLRENGFSVKEAIAEASEFMGIDSNTISNFYIKKARRQK
jgi:hypothetical protein